MRWNTGGFHKTAVFMKLQQGQPPFNLARRADVDGDGEITKKDWVEALTKAGVEVTE